MRLLEFGLVLTTMACSFLAFTSHRVPRALMFVSLGFLVIHLLWDGGRWQMYPVYLVLALHLLLSLRKQRLSKWLRIPGGVLSLLLLILSFILGFYLPVFDLPTPTGEFVVSSSYVHVTDADRKEELTRAPDDLRELMVKTWYPALEVNGTAEDYLLPVEKTGFAAKYGFPSLMSHLNQVKTHTYPELEMAEGEFPVIIFSHGYSVMPNGYYALIEEWVSQGYVVLGINHTYESTGSILSSGAEALFNDEYQLANAWSDEMGEAYSMFKSARSESERMQGARAMVEAYPPTETIVRWSKDIGFVIDQLYKGSFPEQSVLANLDLSRVMVAGHSMGGAAALEAMIDEERIAGGVNLDGAQWGSVIDHKFEKPALFVRSSLFPIEEDINQYVFSGQNQEVFRSVRLSNSGHSNFSDVPYIVRLKMINEAGGIDPDDAMRSLNQLVMTFAQECFGESREVFTKTVESSPFLEEIPVKVRP